MEEKTPKIIGPRGVPFILTGNPFQWKKPVLTVEAWSKWYSLFKIESLGSEQYEVTAVHYHEIDEYHAKKGRKIVSYRDHVPNPTAVTIYAEDMDWLLDELASDLIAGRWYNEADGDEDSYRSGFIDACNHLEEKLNSFVNPALGTSIDLAWSMRGAIQEAKAKGKA